jgi:hypothetical protein
VKFHNGDPFTSADAKFSLERTYDPNVKTHGATVSRPSIASRRRTPDRRHPHQEARSAAAAPARLLRRPDRAEEVSGVGRQRRLQRQAGGHRARAASSRGPRTTSSSSRPTRLLGRQADFDRHHAADPETAPRIAALLKGEVDAITQLPADQGERVAGNATPRGRRALRRALRAGRQQQAAAARQSAREAGALAGPSTAEADRQGAVARARHRAEPADREGRQPLRRLAAAAGL